MNDPQNLGLGELGQRVQAMSDPVTDSRLRPYQGAPLPVAPASNGRPIPPYEPVPFESAHFEPVTFEPAPFAAAPPSALPSQFPQASPAAREPVREPMPGPMEDRRISPLPPPTSLPPYTPNYGLGSANGLASSSASGPVSSISSSLGAFTELPPRPATHAIPEPASNWERVAAASQSPVPGFGAPPTPSGSASTVPEPSAANLPALSDPNSAKSGFQRAIDAVRSALPVVQRILPLLDGNFATAISQLVGTHQQSPVQPVKVNLEPLERGLTEVRNSHRELRTQVLEQVVSLKKVEDQLDHVREATDRNTLEQQELVEDLRSVGNRVNIFAIVGVVLLAVSLVLNIFLLVQLQHILR